MAHTPPGGEGDVCHIHLPRGEPAANAVGLRVPRRRGVAYVGSRARAARVLEENKGRKMW